MVAPREVEERARDRAKRAVSRGTGQEQVESGPALDRSQRRPLVVVRPSRNDEAAGLAARPAEGGPCKRAKLAGRRRNSREKEEGVQEEGEEEGSQRCGESQRERDKGSEMDLDSERHSQRERETERGGGQGEGGREARHRAVKLRRRDPHHA